MLHVTRRKLASTAAYLRSIHATDSPRTDFLARDCGLTIRTDTVLLYTAIPANHNATYSCASSGKCSSSGRGNSMVSARVSLDRRANQLSRDLDRTQSRRGEVTARGGAKGEQRRAVRYGERARGAAASGLLFYFLANCRQTDRSDGRRCEMAGSVPTM